LYTASQSDGDLGPSRNHERMCGFAWKAWDMGMLPSGFM